MVTKTYKQDPEGFKRAWLDENTKKGIRIEFPEFKERVRPVGTENPKSLGWYEHKKKDKRYVLTEDMSVVEGKAYFKNATNPLVYTDEDISDDSFNLKKSIQSGNNADFIGCISSSVKFKVANDFFYLKDQKLTVTLNTLEKAGSQSVTGPLGSFRVGNKYNLPKWNIDDQDCVYEINQLGMLNSVFTLEGKENIIPYPYYDTTKTAGGVTWTDLGNGTIRSNGRASSESHFYIYDNSNNISQCVFDKNTTYTLSLDLRDADDISVYVNVNNTDIAAIKNKTTGHYEITFTTPASYTTRFRVGLYVTRYSTNNNALINVKIGNPSYLYNTYLAKCQSENTGIPCILSIPDSQSDTLWEMKAFTGLVDEVKLDKSRNLVREITAYDYMHKLADDYDITDWYVWQYGDSNADNAQADIQTYSSYQYLPYEGKEEVLYQTVNDGQYYKWIAQPYLSDPDSPPGYYQQTTRNYRTRTIKQLRDSFWQFICNEGTVYDPTGQALKQKGEGFTQLRNQTLINDNVIIGKTLNVSPIDFDQYISGSLVGGPFERHPKTKSESGEYIPGTQYDIYTVSGGWNVSDLVARKQIIELGLVGTLFTYNGKTETHYREYMDDCDNNSAGITATIKIPREEQDKLRETQITAATVLQCICQYNGVFGQFNADGEFEYISLDTLNPYEIEEEYQIEVGYSDTRMPSITGVVIFDKTSEEYASDNIQTEYGEVKNGKKGTALAYYPDDRTKIEGPDSHTYIIDDNFLFNAFDQVDAINVCKTIYNQITGITVRNANLTIKAMPWLRCGECISYYAPTEDTLYPREDLAPSESLYPMDYEHIVSLIMSYEISGTGLFKGKIECNVEDVSSQIVNLNEVISAEMFYRKIGDNRTFSEFQQTANEIKLSVTDRERKLKSYIDVRADMIELEVSGPGGAVSRIAVLENEIDIQSSRILMEAGRIDAIAAEQVNIQSQLINLQAEQVVIKANRVTFEDLAGAGRTTIEGSNIKTGSITGKQIKANSIDCNRIKLGQVTIGSQTYDMQWRRALLVDTQTGMIAHKLGLTINPSDFNNKMYLHYSKTSKTISGTSISYVDSIWIDTSSSGGDGTAAIGCLSTGNLLYNNIGGSQAGYCAWGTTADGDSNGEAYWYLRPSGGDKIGYRLILASENRA